jgi:hypothetical protein
VRGTYILLSIERGLSYNITRKLAIKGHSLPIKHRGEQLLEHKSKQVRNTYCLLSAEQVRTQKESKKARETYNLSSTKRDKLEHE